MKLLTVLTVSTLLSPYASFSLPVKKPLPCSDYHTCCWEAAEREVSHFVMYSVIFENLMQKMNKKVAEGELRSIQCTSCGPNIYHRTIISQSHDCASKNMPFYFQWNFLKTLSSLTQLCVMNFLVFINMDTSKKGKPLLVYAGFKFWFHKTLTNNVSDRHVVIKTVRVSES